MLIYGVLVNLLIQYKLCRRWPVKQYVQQNNARFYDLIRNVSEWMWWEIKKTYCSRWIICVATTDGTYSHAETLARRSIVHGITTTGNIGFRCCKTPQKRNKHHYIWHDVDELKDGKINMVKYKWYVGKINLIQRLQIILLRRRKESKNKFKKVKYIKRETFILHAL